MTVAPLGLAPAAAQARLILHQAQAEMAAQLWRAALGSEDGSGATASIGGADCECAGGSSLLGVIDGLEGLQALTQQPDSPSIKPFAAPPTLAVPVAPDMPANPIARLGSGSMTNLGPNARYADHLEAAGSRTGLGAPLLAAIVDAEAGHLADGSWNVRARNPRSSAAGLGQFLSGSWLDLARDPSSWLGQQARTKGWVDGNGRISPTARNDLLALRFDPAASINAIADYARANLDRLKRAGHQPPPTIEGQARMAYLGHYLGPGDALAYLGGRLGERRSRVLLNAQIGPEAAARRIAQSGGAEAAHSRWLEGHIARKIRPERYAAAPSTSLPKS